MPENLGKNNAKECKKSTSGRTALLLSPELDWGGVGRGQGGGSIQAHAFAQDILSWQFSDISEKIKNNSGLKFVPFLLTRL